MSMRRLLVWMLCCCLLFVTLWTTWIVLRWQYFLHHRLPIPVEGVVVDLKPGTPLTLFAEQLHEQQLLPKPHFFIALAKITGEASNVKAGHYFLAYDTTPYQLLDQLVAGRTVQYAVRIGEGWTFNQVLTALATHEKLQHSLQGISPDLIMQQLQHPQQHPEGRFFPDTYFVNENTQDIAVLKRAYAKMETVLQQAWQQRESNLPYKTAYDALIMASIIEKEAGLDSERGKVAGVLVRRLKKGMRLQVDPTVIYGMGAAFDGDLRRADLRRPTPYNTYVIKGLPPTPIAMPSKASLIAALHPESGNTYYYVADGQGGHVFSETLQQHQKAVYIYQIKAAQDKQREMQNER